MSKFTNTGLGDLNVKPPRHVFHYTPQDLPGQTVCDSRIGLGSANPLFLSPMTDLPEQ